MKCNTNREERNQFNRAASSYEAIRPGYPTHVFNEITSYGHLTAESMVLEIGMGSGQATEQLLN